MTLQTFSQLYNTAFQSGDHAILWRVDAQSVNSIQPEKIDLRMIMLMRKGSMQVRIDRQDYELIAGGFADIDGTNRVVKYLSATSEAEGYALLFTNDFIFNVFNNRPPFDVSYVDYVRSHPVSGLNDRITNTLWDAFRSLEYSFRDSDNIFRHQLINNKVLTIFFEISNYHVIYEALMPKSGDVTDRCSSLFNKLVVLIRDHAQCEHGVEFYASSLCITPQYLGKIVRDTVHKSASTLINDAVTSVIKKMLENQSLSLQQIVLKMNFSDQAVFTKFFKRQTGQTPMQYRNLL